AVARAMRLRSLGAAKRVRPPAAPLVDAWESPAIMAGATVRGELQQRPSGRHQEFLHIGLKSGERNQIGERISARGVVVCRDDERQVIFFFADPLDPELLTVPAEQPVRGLYIDLHNRPYRIQSVRALSASVSVPAQKRAVVRSRFVASTTWTDEVRANAIDGHDA